MKVETRCPEIRLLSPKKFFLSFLRSGVIDLLVTWLLEREKGFSIGSVTPHAMEAIGNQIIRDCLVSFCRYFSYSFTRFKIIWGMKHLVC